ncbi:MAG: hypothetical protein PVG65_01865 [Candidatus Thorarchaeota archaeon]|jgi:hypothetical protein
MIQSKGIDHKGFDGEHVLVRRPAIPRWWNPIARPHVAVLLIDSETGKCIRYYLSSKGERTATGRVLLDVYDIENLPEGTLLEIRFDSMTANLYKLEIVDGVSCWRWINRSRGLNDFEYPTSIDWNHSNHSCVASPAGTASF